MKAVSSITLGIRRLLSSANSSILNLFLQRNEILISSVFPNGWSLSRWGTIKVWFENSSSVRWEMKISMKTRRRWAFLSSCFSLTYHPERKHKKMTIFFSRDVRVKKKERSLSYDQRVYMIVSTLLARTLRIIYHMSSDERTIMLKNSIPSMTCHLISSLSRFIHVNILSKRFSKHFRVFFFFLFHHFHS